MIHMPLLPEYIQHFPPMCSQRGEPFTSLSATGTYSPAQRCCPFGDWTYSVEGLMATVMAESSTNLSPDSRSQTQSARSGVRPPWAYLEYMTPFEHLKLLSLASFP